MDYVSAQRVRTLEKDVKSIIATQDKIQAHVVDVESRVQTVEKQYDALLSTVSGIQNDVNTIKSNNPQFVYKMTALCMFCFAAMVRPEIIVIAAIVPLAIWARRHVC